ncbi:MAG: 8-amino-7-oxononanoate synthase [Thermoguttaceae bacterium]|nr:8-amino-7-oxononanoate synthase [Thermoguttaceae bacterium]
MTNPDTWFEDGDFPRRIYDFQAKTAKEIVWRGKKLVNLSSNNYLGLADQQALVQAFLREEGSRYAFGSTSSRLLCGTLPVYERLESWLAEHFQKEASLVFNSGWHANTGIISSLAEKSDIIFADRLVHASMIDGIKLSGAKFYRFHHRDMENLSKLLRQHRSSCRRAFVLTESIFSMDGDAADLAALVRLKDEYDAFLIVDEAHAFGLFGPNGLGLAEQYRLMAQTDLLIGTFSKAIGSLGGFAVCSATVRRWLVNRARPLIFSTSLPPIAIAWTLYVLENLIPSLAVRNELLSQASWLREHLLKKHLSVSGVSQIVPVIPGSVPQTLQLSERLYETGFCTLPIRPPTVPPNQSRIRLSLTTAITRRDLERLLEVMDAMFP